MKSLKTAGIVLVSLSAFTTGASAAQDSSLAVGLAVDQQLSAVVELNNTMRLIVGNDGAAFDYLFAKGDLNTQYPLTWYVGGGAWAEWDDDFGARLPIGINWSLPHNWEAYGQIQPELQLNDDVELQIGAAAGIKYRF